MIKLLLPLLLVCCVQVQAQKIKEPVQYKTVFGFSPLALFQDDNVLMVNGEYRFSDKKAVVVDAGYVFASYYLKNIKNVSGFLFRPAYRRYLSSQNNYYVQYQVFFKSVTYQMHEWLDKEVVNGVPSYQELKDFRYRKNVGGGNIMIGTIQPLFKSSGYIDLYMGLGLRYKSSYLVNEPNYEYHRPPSLLSDQHTLFSMPIGIKFLFVIK
jgi:hypothetical protein